MGSQSHRGQSVFIYDDDVIVSDRLASENFSNPGSIYRHGVQHIMISVVNFLDYYFLLCCCYM